MKIKVVLISVFVFSIVPFVADAASPCHQITTPAGVLQGFGAPFEVLNSTGALLIETQCDPGQVEVSVGTGSSFEYIYELGYRWAGTGWQQYTLSGPQKSGVWIEGNAAATLSVPQSEIDQGGFLVAYMCTWDGSAWKCGCSDAACAQPAWQIQKFQQTTTQPPAGGSSSGGGATEVIRPMQGDLEILLDNFDTPWDMAFLPDGTILITERKGTVVHVDKNEIRTITDISSVVENSESGLHGIALHPNFAQNNYVYIYYKHTNGPNRIERYTLNTKKLTQQVLILDGIPSLRNHGGGRIRFGDDGYLYITTGDASNANSAQNTNSLGGKILRITDSGDPVPGNPFNSEVYSLGHRNPQGIAWDGAGRLWSAEHGPSGGSSGCDEINLIESGGNYGWPNVACNETASGQITPKHQTTPSVTWAPSGIAYWNNRLSTLR